MVAVRCVASFAQPGQARLPDEYREDNHARDDPARPLDNRQDAVVFRSSGVADQAEGCIP